MESELVNIGIAKKDRNAVGKLLNTLLADEYVLYTKTLQFHWNVQGSLFDPLHAFFKRQYEELFDIVDDVAERARALGIVSAGSLHEFLALTRLDEIHGTQLSAQEMIAHLLQDHEHIIQAVRKDIDACAEKYHDMGTNNFLTDLMEKHEKMAWMLRASLEL